MPASQFDQLVITGNAPAAGQLEKLLLPVVSCQLKVIELIGVLLEFIGITVDWLVDILSYSRELGV
jgi:hypothetical protein